MNERLADADLTASVFLIKKNNQSEGGDRLADSTNALF
jgi:hypothetical protein